ncbi:AlpA family transcriptional regulator [Sulfuriferula sp. AH1]|uniref:helix-turn-helix transcriptional regulator n=1 Tax=Sulfuriferula sp. AH1 TaxID=1985873 RepID=UPI0012F8D304|nr:hypothetical protein [Sulfuriferula sp. AH1]
MSRNYQLLERMSSLPDDILVGVEEVAEITGFAQITIQQRRIKGFPLPINNVRILKWRLGNIREWIRSSGQSSSAKK